MHISVVIPTFNRSRILKECLQALYRQDLPEKDYEVIVVDDGSKDETKRVVSHFLKNHGNVVYLRQQNQGWGVARNLGIGKARGNIIVLIADDILVTEDFLTQHLRYHLRYPNENQAVLGLTAWYPKLTITPYMNWLTDGSSVFGKICGRPFAYAELAGKKEADYSFFYTTNISLKRTLLEKFPFDPSLSTSGWADMELGYRLYRRVGLKIFYNSMAIGYHDHAMSEESLALQMHNIGASAHIFHRKYPELHKVPSVWKRVVFWLFSNSLTMGVLGILRNMSQGKWDGLYFSALSKKYFLEGLHN